MTKKRTSEHNSTMESKQCHMSHHRMIVIYNLPFVLLALNVLQLLVCACTKNVHQPGQRLLGK